MATVLGQLVKNLSKHERRSVFEERELCVEDSCTIYAEDKVVETYPGGGKERQRGREKPEASLLNTESKYFLRKKTLISWEGEGEGESKQRNS